MNAALRPLCLCAVLLLLAALPLAAQQAFPLPGEWPCYRGGPTLQARSRLKGHLTTPRIAWKHFVGAMATQVVVERAAASGTLALPDPQAPLQVLDTSDPRWGLAPAPGEFAGKRQDVPRDINATYADLFPAYPGLEKVVFESGFDKPTVNGQWQPCVGRCFGWQDGAWVKLWETEPIKMLFQALPLAGDFDGDGQPEIAFLPWYELILLDARTGAIKYRCPFTKQRSYGFFGAYDFEGDGRSEFLVQADFCKHVEVLGFRDGQLKLLWQEEIEPDISNPQKVLRAYPRPVADVDGDRRPEVTLSVYNAAGDHRWHVVIRDAVSGEVEADLPGECLAGICDLDGDGVAELLTSVTAGASPPPYGTIRVRGLRGGQPATLWESADSAWAAWEPPLPPNVNSAATFARRDVLCRPAAGGAWAVTRQAVPGVPGACQLAVGRWAQDSFVFPMTVSGPRLEALALSPEGALLASCLTAPGQSASLAVTKGQARALSAQYDWGEAGTPAVVWATGEPQPTIVVQGQGEELVALRPPRGEQPAAERWRWSGRAPSVGWPYANRGPVLADLRGDGQRQVLYATASPGGGAALVAAALDGREVWRHDFPAIPGTPPVWNTGGLILWQVAHLTNPQALDVVVTVRRSMMHSEETYGLSGQDGRELWHRDRQVSNRGVGGTPFALADYDGDGLDDVASFHPSLVYLLKGSTGQDLLARDATWPEVPAQPVYWGLPLAGDFTGTGQPSLFFATERRSMTGVVRTDGSLVWSDALDLSPQSLPAIGDFDGDGRLEALGIGYEDGVRCYDTATGQVEWRMPTPVPGAPVGCASADLNSDGRDEAVFVTGATVFCLATENGAGKLLWRLELPAPGAAPAIADLEGQGEPSILVVGRDLYVYCLR